jgi:hypothetical protein
LAEEICDPEIQERCRDLEETRNKLAIAVNAEIHTRERSELVTTPIYQRLLGIQDTIVERAEALLGHGDKPHRPQRAAGAAGEERL